MTDTQSAKPEGELPTTDAPTVDNEAKTAEEIVVDAMTGEVETISAEEAAADEVAEGSEREVAVLDIPEGISPELFHDPYGEEELDTSKEEFEALLSQFSGDFQDFREGEIVNAQVLRVTDTTVILEFGFKSEGAVALDEFKETPESGAEVEVLLESLEDDERGEAAIEARLAALKQKTAEE